MNGLLRDGRGALLRAPPAGRLPLRRAAPIRQPRRQVALIAAARRDLRDGRNPPRVRSRSRPCAGRHRHDARLPRRELHVPARARQTTTPRRSPRPRAATPAAGPTTGRPTVTSASPASQAPSGFGVDAVLRQQPHGVAHRMRPRRGRHGTAAATPRRPRSQVRPGAPAASREPFTTRPVTGDGQDERHDGPRRRGIQIRRGSATRAPRRASRRASRPGARTSVNSR